MRRDLLVGAATSTGTQTTADWRSLHQWALIQQQFGWDCRECSMTFSTPWSRTKAESSIPTAMLEQMKGRIHNISQDMHILNGCCGEELVRSSPTRARRSAPNQLAATPPTDEAVAQRKRARFYKGSSPCPIVHTMTDTSPHLHITTFHSHNSSSHRMMHHERGTVSWSVLHSLRLKTDDSHEPGLPTSARAQGSLESVSERRKIQDLPRTTESGRWQSNRTPLRVARTP